jgi:hypothetical protein
MGQAMMNNRQNSLKIENNAAARRWEVHGEQQLAVGKYWRRLV